MRYCHPGEYSTLTENIALDKLLKRPEVKYSAIKKLSPSPEILTPEIEALVEIRVKYEGYVQKQIELAGRFNKFESKKIPPVFDYTSIPGLSKEVIEKLRDVQPETIGQAGRIPGITPAAVSIFWWQWNGFGNRAGTPEKGLSELGISAQSDTVVRFLSYLFELKKWNRAYNLTAPEE